jgi:hypothetical protein
MFDAASPGKKDGAKLNESIDRIREKYGSEYIVRGSLLNFNKNHKRNKKNKV